MSAIAELCQTKYWQLHLPEGWTTTTRSPELVILYSPGGVGMMEFHMVNEQFDENAADVERFGQLVGKYAGEKAHRGVHRRFWQLSCGGRKLSLCYNCSEGNAEVERAQVDAMLQTLESGDQMA